MSLKKFDLKSLLAKLAYPNRLKSILLNGIFEPIIKPDKLIQDNQPEFHIF